MTDKMAGIINRAKRAIESNPVAAAGLGMGVYFGGKIGQQYGAPAAGVAGSVGGLLAGEQIIRRSLKTGDPYKVFGATIVGSMAPVWGAQLSARAFGQPPQYTHKLAAWEVGVVDAMTKEAFLKKFRARRAVQKMGGPEAVKKKATELFHRSMRYSDFKARKAELGLMRMMRTAGYVT